MTPPRHVDVFRWLLAALVLAAALVALLLVPWPDVVAALDPWVDGPRRSSLFG